jgi:hypothetical protein
MNPFTVRCRSTAAKVKQQAEEPLPRIEWDVDKSAATYDLIAQMEVKENYLELVMRCIHKTGL